MKTSTKYLLAIILIVLQLVYYHEIVFAESDTGDNVTTNTEDSYIDKVYNDFTVDKIREDFLVPTSPAFYVLGITPDEVIRPDTPKSLALALINGIDSKGVLQNGFAIDFAPFRLSSSRKMSIDEYRNDYSKQMLQRLQISIASTKASEDDTDESMKLALGLRVALFDKADPRLSKQLDASIISTKQDELDKTQLKVNHIGSDIEKKQERIEEKNKEIILLDKQDEKVNPLKDDLKRLEHEKETLIKQRIEAEDMLDKISDGEAEVLNDIWTKANKEFEKKAWNATNLTIGIAPVFFSEEGYFRNLTNSGFAAYATYAYGFEGIKKLEDTSQLIIHARYRVDEEFANPLVEGDFIDQDTTLLGAQFRIAFPNIGEKTSGRDLTFFGECDYLIKNRVEIDDDRTTKYAVGVEYKVAEDMTFSLTVGDESGDNERMSGVFMLGSLKWAL